MLSVILIEPKLSANVGSVARVMKNFGFTQLILVNPKCNPHSGMAKNRAKHAQEILKQIKIVKRWPRADTYIGTTAQLGTDYNIPRSPITPNQLTKLLEGRQHTQKDNIALVIGRDSTGLTNEELQKCDFLVTIPATKEYPTLNLAQATGILLYELAKEKEVTVSSHIRFASSPEKKQLRKMMNQLLSKLKFPQPHQKETQQKVWQRMIGKTFLTKREAFALMGLFRRIEWLMKKKK